MQDNCIQCGQPKDLYTLCDFCDKLVCKECKTHRGCEDTRVKMYVFKNSIGLEVSVDDLKAAIIENDAKKIREELDMINIHHNDLESYLTGDDNAL